MSVTDQDVDSTPPPPLRRNRDFRLLWAGAGFSMLGNTVTSVAYPLLLIWYGRSTIEAGWVAFASLLPMLLLMLPAGVLVDRWDRRRTMIICDLVSLVSIGSVAVSLITGHLWLPHLLAVAFLEGSAVVFYRLSERAAVRNVVHPDHLSAAMSQNEARSRAAGLLGQPLSSTLFAVIRWAPFVFTAVCHLIALVSLLLVRAPFQAARPAGRPRRMHFEIREGLGWLLRQRFLRSALGLVATTNVLFQVLSLSLVVIIKNDGGSPAYIGFIGAVSGAGGILGALSGSFFVQRFSPAKVIIGVFAVWAVLMPSIALTGNPLVLGALFAGMTFAGALMNVMAGVYQVQITPDGMQGRIGSVAGLISSGANSLGALAGGFLLHAYGTGRTVLAVGAVMVLVTAYAAASPAIRSANAVVGQRPAPDDQVDQPQNV